MLTEEITLRLVKEIKRFLLEDALALSRSSDEQLMVRIKEIIDHKLVHYEITPQEREKIARRVFSSLRGLGILDELLDDDSIPEHYPGIHEYPAYSCIGWWSCVLPSLRDDYRS